MKYQPHGAPKRSSDDEGLYTAEDTVHAIMYFTRLLLSDLCCIYIFGWALMTSTLFCHIEQQNLTAVNKKEE